MFNELRLTKNYGGYCLNKHNKNEKHHHSHKHVHEVSDLSGKKIFWVTVLNAAITGTEFIGGIISGSLSLLSDSVHNLSDTLAIMLSYFAHRISHKPKNSKKTFGYKRAEIIAAFINASVLFAVSFMLIIEAFKRFANPEPISGNLMITVAIIGLAANLLSVILLQRDSHTNMNIKSSYLHLLSDTVSSVGVVIGGIMISLFDIYWIDPVITLLISVYILYNTFKIIRDSINMLMQTSPDVDYQKIKEDIESIKEIVNIHHVHAWMLDEKSIFFEAHLDLINMPLKNVEEIIHKVEKILKSKYGFTHTTLQPEIDKCENKELF